MTHRLRTGAAAKEAFTSAAPFTVFPPYSFRGLFSPKQRPYWEIYGIDGPTEAVRAKAEELGIFVTDEEPERDDEHALDSFDDLDAAVQALASGLWLVKIPDALSGKNSRYYHLMMVDKIVPTVPALAERDYVRYPHSPRNKPRKR